MENCAFKGIIVKYKQFYKKKSYPYSEMCIYIHIYTHTCI